MKIKLRTQLREPLKTVTVEKGTTIHQLYQKYKKDLPYTVLLAKVDNEYKSLGNEITEPCTIEFLDMRNWAACLVYQHSLSLIYLAASRDVIGQREIMIHNSLNQGLYIEVRSGTEITEEEVEKIAAQMRWLIDSNLPIEHMTLTRERAIEIMKHTNRPAAVQHLEEIRKDKMLDYFVLDGYTDYFFGPMAPYTGYIQLFELKSYRGGLLLRFPVMGVPDEIPPFDDETRLYDTFRVQSEWEHLLNIDFVPALNKVIQSENRRALVLLSEALHEKKIANLADRIVKADKRIVLIAGPSSSGKTTFAQRLCVQLVVNGKFPLYLGTDDYFVEREQTPLDANGEPNYEGIDALDIELFNHDMNALLAGEEVDIPSFDFLTGHKVFGTRKTTMRSDQIIVIEGIHGLNQKLTEQIPAKEKFKIYISPLTQLNMDEHCRISNTDERMIRRMVRDYRFRGHDAAATIRNWPKVRAGEDENIFPYSNEADELFDSYHVYEIACLKKYADPILRAVQPDQPEYAEAQRMLTFLNSFRPLKDDSVIPNNSIIREFIGGSVFVK